MLSKDSVSSHLYAIDDAGSLTKIWLETIGLIKCHSVLKMNEFIKVIEWFKLIFPLLLFVYFLFDKEDAILFKVMLSFPKIFEALKIQLFDCKLRWKWSQLLFVHFLQIWKIIVKVLLFILFCVFLLLALLLYAF